MAGRYGISHGIDIIYIILACSCGKSAQIGAVLKKQRKIITAEIHQIIGIEQRIYLA